MTEKATIVVQSGDFDKLYSALIIANGALAMGMEASMFFTFWGLQRLKKGQLESGPLSKMNFLGLGKWMIKRRMKKANAASMERMLADFVELGGKLMACDMTMGAHGHHEGRPARRPHQRLLRGRLLHPGGPRVRHNALHLAYRQL